MSELPKSQNHPGLFPHPISDSKVYLSSSNETCVTDCYNLEPTYGDAHSVAIWAAPHHVTNGLDKLGITIENVNSTKNVNSTYQDTGFTPLMAAATAANTVVIQPFIAIGARVNLQDHNGDSALMIAAKNGYTEIVAVLLNKDEDRVEMDNVADVNLQDTTGETALFAAVKEGHTEIVRMLLANGADVNIENNDRKTVFDLNLSDGMKAMLEEADTRSGWEKFKDCFPCLPWSHVPSGEVSSGPVFTVTQPKTQKQETSIA